MFDVCIPRISEVQYGSTPSCRSGTNADVRTGSDASSAARRRRAWRFVNAPKRIAARVRSGGTPVATKTAKVREEEVKRRKKWCEYVFVY